MEAMSEQFGRSFPGRGIEGAEPFAHNLSLFGSEAADRLLMRRALLTHRADAALPINAHVRDAQCVVAAQLTIQRIARDDDLGQPFAVRSRRRITGELNRVQTSLIERFSNQGIALKDELCLPPSHRNFELQILDFILADMQS